MITLDDINERSRNIFQRLVETYLASGEPVGSRTLSNDDAIGLSAATVRNVMSDLTDVGLLHAPHISAGRLPTERGLRLFVDGLMQVSELSDRDRQAIEAESAASDVESLLERAASQLAGLTQSASLVMTPRHDAAVRQTEFVSIAPGKTLAVIVFDDGRIENRILDTPPDLPPSALVAASNYLNSRLHGISLAEARELIDSEMHQSRAELDELTARLVREGVAELGGGDEWSMIVRGRSNLIDKNAVQDVERVRQLFEDLEKKRDLAELLNAAKTGAGVKIFIGSENKLFSLSGSSVIAAPYRDENRKIVGVLGVIGPTRMNYAKVIPVVDYAAEHVSKLLK